MDWRVDRGGWRSVAGRASVGQPRKPGRRGVVKLLPPLLGGYCAVLRCGLWKWPFLLRDAAPPAGGSCVAVFDGVGGGASAPE